MMPELGVDYLELTAWAAVFRQVQSEHVVEHFKQKTAATPFPRQCSRRRRSGVSWETIVVDGPGTQPLVEAEAYLQRKPLRLPVAAMLGGIVGLPLTRTLHYIAFERKRELARSVAAVVNH